jgi:isocitrate dehydrogenase (NAD+)
MYTDLLSQLYSKIRTPDMGGNSTTHEFTKAILNKMENSL